MAISGDIFKINQVYELIQEGQWPTTFFELPNNTHGWFVGGLPSPYRSTVDRIDFSDDTTTALVRGTLSISSQGTAIGAATGNADYGWFGGGYRPSTPISSVLRITYVSDTDAATLRGPLTFARKYLAASGNDLYGWFGGGYNAFNAKFSQVDRIDFADDTSTASVRGPLSIARGWFSSCSNQNYGWFGGGYSSSPSPSAVNHISRIDRIDFNADTSTASVRSSLSIGKRGTSATSNQNYGWFGGGVNPSISGAITSVIERLNFSDDTNSTSTRAPLVRATWIFDAVENNSYSWFAGGGTPGGIVSYTQRINFSDDTITASDRAYLSLARNYLRSSSGIL